MADDYATNVRVDALVAAIRQDLLDTERLLRDRDDQVQATLRAEFKDEIAVLRSAQEEDFEDIKGRLSWQNKAWLVPAISTVMLGLLYVFLHLAFGIG